MKVDKNNFRSFEPDFLAHGIGNGTIELAETGVEALVEIVKFISTAIANGPRGKRIRALEDYVRAQVNVNNQIVERLHTAELEILALKNR